MIVQKLNSYVHLMRVHQYYKNTLIAVCLVFGGHLFDLAVYIELLFGFIVLALISSSGYIINDLFDIKVDKIHPDKKKRPLASGQIKPYEAIVIALLLFVLAIIIGYILSLAFLLVALGLFLLTLSYTLFGKHLPILDLLFISTNYVIRAASGCVLVEDRISPWLYICGFLFALFLSVGKRYSDIAYLGREKAMIHRKVFEVYTKEFLYSLMIISTTSLLVSYAIYVVQTGFVYLPLSLPVFIFVVLRYYMLVLTTYKGRHPHELIFFDKQILIAGILFMVILSVSLYI